MTGLHKNVVFQRFAPRLIHVLLVVILLAGAATIVWIEAAYTAQAEQQAQAQAKILSAAVTAALDFRDEDVARQTINAFGANRRIRTVAVYERAGRLLAGYARSPEDAPPRQLAASTRPRPDLLTIVMPVQQAGARIGTISITSEREPLSQRLARYILLGLLVVLVVIVIFVLDAAQASLQRINDALRAQARQLSEANENLRLQIVEREKAEAATREVDALFRAYWENTTESLFVVDVQEDGQFVLSSINPANTQTLAITADEIRGRKPDDLLSPAQALAVEDNYRRCVRTGAVQNYTETLQIGGKVLHYETVLVPIRASDGRVTRIMGSGRDVSERIRLEEALRQSQKMEAMGELTGGVAHDFNNLLTPIVGTLDLLQRRGVGGEREQRLIAAAAQSADRAKTLVQRLLAFARRQPLQASAVDLAALASGMVELIASTIGPHIGVTLQAAPDLPPANVDANQLEMAILNLAVNSRDAMPAGGTLRIIVDKQTVANGHRSGLAPGDYLYLAVADDGEGMSPATVAQAIEPFFSTKGIGKGTGLGLSMVHGLAMQLGGALTIESQLGSGTTVELWLPQSDRARVTPEPTAPCPTLRDGKGLVLLVDDEALVRFSTADLLIELGYSVVEADNAKEALRLLDEGIAPDIIITDHLMPGMTGVELAQQVRGRWPGTKVVIVSGYADQVGLSPDLPRLTKPFRSLDLAATLEALA